MRMHSTVAGLLVFAATAAVPAQSRLQTKVYTSTPDGFSVTSTLVFGERDAVLIDPQFLLSEAHKAAAMVLESRKNLTAVYTTHGHPDHYFGLAVMKQAFPATKLVALPSVVAAIRNGWDARYKVWSATYGSNVPATGPILPEELPGTTFRSKGRCCSLSVPSRAMGRTTRTSGFPRSEPWLQATSCSAAFISGSRQGTLAPSG